MPAFSPAISPSVLPAHKPHSKHGTVKLHFSDNRDTSNFSCMTNQEFPYGHIQGKIFHKLQVLQPAEIQIYKSLMVFDL
jgi:hypothetical protein